MGSLTELPPRFQVVFSPGSNPEVGSGLQAWDENAALSTADESAWLAAASVSVSVPEALKARRAHEE
jgi:hypothetical protein